MAIGSSTGIPPIPDRYEGLDNAETFGKLKAIPGRPEPTALAYFAEWIAGLASTLQTVSGGAQTGTVGTVLTTPLVVKVTDSDGTPVAGVRVLFQVRELDARIDGRIAIAATTGSDGRATVSRWQLGQSVGPQHVDASVAGTGVSTTFEAEATAPGYSGSTPRQPPAKSSGPSGSKTS